jgi:hypothetical protein
LLVDIATRNKHGINAAFNSAEDAQEDRGLREIEQVNLKRCKIQYRW